jgi:hypothetical protein
MPRQVATSDIVRVTHGGRTGIAYLEVLLFAPTEQVPQNPQGLPLAVPLRQSRGLFRAGRWEVPHFFGSGGRVVLPASALAGVSDESVVQFQWHFRPDPS